MLHVNSDVLFLIIDNVDDGGALFSLLTVSKHVFQRACWALYRDPGFILRQKGYESRKTSTVAFVRLMLAISPAGDSSTSMLRLAFDVSRADGPPMLDYLSLIRVVRWKDVLTKCFAHVPRDLKDLVEWNCLVDGVPDDFPSLGVDCLTRAICLHQLGNIVELEIQPAGIVEYLHRAPQARCLRRIFIVQSHQQRAVYLLAICLVKAIQYHHGRDQIYDCQVTQHYTTYHSDSRYELHSKLELLLPPPGSLKNLPKVLEAPEALPKVLEAPISVADRTLAKLETLIVHARGKYEWGRICSQYPSVPSGRILQRFRSLTKLSVEIAQGLIEEADLFEWAAQEARDRVANKQVPPMMRVGNLTLHIKALDLCGARRVVKDALVGFRRSLIFLRVHFEPQRQALGDNDDEDCSDDESDSGGEDDPSAPRCLVQDKALTLPQLKHIFFLSNNPRLFDARLLQISHNLTDLTIRLGGPKSASFQSQSWPPLHFTKLASLTLADAAVRSFDPESFANMPSLKDLSVSEASKDSSQEVAPWMERWTWDWHMPSLTHLYVRCAKGQWFSLGVLRGCPKLAHLLLETTRKYSLDVSSILQKSQDSFKAVESFQLLGHCEVTFGNVQHLLQHSLPCVKKLELAAADVHTAARVVASTCGHPTLKHVLFPKLVLTPGQLEEMRLVQNRGDSKRDLKKENEFIEYFFNFVSYRLSTTQ
ncbi:hypothetical protein DFQ27_006578 [Actinomortierella ambigua]|uniref:Uncharacterized protein n=1 Tax=Actinomortierella ambigua TaxID=1343610 RepID=A0A9P6PVF7_9FUNG|nr:hypothetical protein DFQ27_006578 [Actinomortierella ambigua]